MTSLKRRLDNILSEIMNINQEINVSENAIPCHLVFHEQDQLSCDVLGPLPRELFFQECSKCKAKIKELIDYFNKKKEKTGA